MMRFPIFKLLSIGLILGAQLTYAAEQNSAEVAYKNCTASWVQGLTKNHPEITAVDVKYVSAYYCLCAIENAGADTAQADPAEKQKQIYKKCMPYAVLRNALHYEVETATSKLKAGAGALYGACQFAFPHDPQNKDDVAVVANFCDCASKPLADVEAQKKNLPEDQLKEKVYTIAAGCTGKNDSSE